MSDGGHSAPGEFRRLWSLWDIMRQVSIAQLLMLAAVGGLASVKVDLAALSKDRSGSDKINDDLKASFLETYIELEEECVQLGLVASLATVKKIQVAFKKPSLTHTDLAPLHVELQSRLIDETRGRIFWALSTRESEFYGNSRKGWEKVIERYPETVGDIEEASKCFALSRYAAAVFHSVQVVESGLIELGKLIGVVDPKSGWTATTSRLSGIIKKGHEARTPYEREHFAFFEQMHGTIEGLKNAWRNKVSHAQGRLTLLAADFAPDIAEEILFATRAFMRRLATEAPPSGAVPLEPA